MERLCTIIQEQSRWLRDLSIPLPQTNYKDTGTKVVNGVLGACYHYYRKGQRYHQWWTASDIDKLRIDDQIYKYRQHKNYNSQDKQMDHQKKHYTNKDRHALNSYVAKPNPREPRQ